MEKRSSSTFRGQIGHAALYGAHSESARARGFQLLAPDNRAIDLSSAELELQVKSWSDREVSSLVQLLAARQPLEAYLENWSDLDVLKLRAHLALRLGNAKGLPTEIKDRALARTYPLSRLPREGESPYRSGRPGETVSRTERSALYSRIAEQVEANLSIKTTESVATESPRSGAVTDDFEILDAYELYTFPADTSDKLRITRAVTVRALRDGVTEYRFNVETISRGRDSPDLELLAGPSPRLERLVTRSRAGVEGYEYQVVLPFATPMNRSDPPRRLSWMTRSTVSPSFFEEYKATRAIGFRPQRALRSASVAVQFPKHPQPEVVGVVTGGHSEDKDVFKQNGKTLPVVDGYVEQTWNDLIIGRFYNLVWER